MHVDACAVARHLAERGGKAGRAAVLQRLDEPRLDELDGNLDELLAGERVTDLDRRPLVGIVLAEFLAREHGCAADAVAARRRAEEDDDVTGAVRLRRLQPVRVEQADAHRVHEAVAAIGLVPHRLTADCGDADAVAVVADAGDGAVEVMAGRAEPQPVEERDRPRAHGDDVAQDPAHAGGGALERLDRRGMVVRLDLEGDREALAEVEHARVLARPLQHPLAGGWKPAQKRRRVLVAAVLRPEDGEDGELEVVRIAAEKLPDSVRLPVREAECAVERLFRDLRQVIQSSLPFRWAREAAVRLPLGRSRSDLGVVVLVHQGRYPRPLAGRAD